MPNVFLPDGISILELDEHVHLIQYPRSLYRFHRDNK
jgi:hypothetical protein